MWVRRASFNLLSLFLLVWTTRARFVNISIDDTFGDPVTGQHPRYLPNLGIWYGSTCFYQVLGPGTSDLCTVVPPSPPAFEKTWTGALYDPLDPRYNATGINITLSFIGISIWIFFILPTSPGSDPIGPMPPDTACNFTLDDNYMGSFFHHASGNVVQYNASVFNATGLSNSQHKLVISTKYPHPANIFFDYAIYTADVPDTITSSTTSTIVRSSSTQTGAVTRSPSSNSKLRIILGCVLGGLGLVALVVALVFRYRYSRRNKKDVIEPPLGTSFNQQPLVEDLNDVARTSIVSTDPEQNSIRNENVGTSEVILFDQHGVIRSNSFESTDRAATLVPFRQFESTQAPNRKGQDEVRAARQMEINQHLQTAQQEIQDLTSRQSAAMRSETGHDHVSLSSSDVRRRETEREMEVMREQIRHLNTRIEYLHTQLSSDWAQGLSDEPPPAYY